MPLNINKQFYDLTTNRKYHEALALIEQLIERRVDQKVIMMDVIAKTLQNLQRFDEDPNSSGFSSLTLLAIARIYDDALHKVFAHATMDGQYIGTVLIGTPQNEFHSLGKTIISSFLRLYNWKVTDNL